MDTLLTLANIHPRDRVAYWHDRACKTITKHDCRVPTSSKLYATIECMPLGELGFVKGESFGLDRIERTARHIAQGDDDIFLLRAAARRRHAQPRRPRNHLASRRFCPPRRTALQRLSPYRKQVTIRIPHRALKARLAGSSELIAHAVPAATVSAASPPPTPR